MEYLKKKWSVWFQTLDDDRDGVISTKDVGIATKKFAGIKEELERRDKSGDKGPESREFDINKWWNVYIFRRGSEVKMTNDEFEMTNDEFVNSLAEAYQKDNAAFPEEMERCFEDIANFLTPDMKRDITKEEFADAFKAFMVGQVDEKKIEEAYELFMAAHEKLTVQLIVDAWVQFTADVDQSKQDIIMEIYGN
ncbi:sarcoplasmic calcium-binding protein-like [Crassostrea angulata]|uniref:sarcoplasmic calcium-binding protein-like n=1 Tax=Magallana angulata TaxID=2784310 RepID=UPI0022B0F628|nr:sarcoplasmic calcium-binding protein-like [Crassostrea angulata]